MLRHLLSGLALVAIASADAAQEAQYSESRVAPSRVPPTFLRTAGKEAPGVRFSNVYKDNEQGYRFVGKAANGRTYSVRIDRQSAGHGPGGRAGWPPRSDVQRRQDAQDLEPSRPGKVSVLTARQRLTHKHERVLLVLIVRPEPWVGEREL